MSRKGLNVQRDRFVATRKDRWEQLEILLKRAGRSRWGKLGGEDIFTLGQLYRMATSDLAIAQRDFPRDRVSLYLNALVGRAHSRLYQDRGAGAKKTWRFVQFGFPAAWREIAPYTLMAFGLFLSAAVVSAGLVVWRSSLADVLQPGTAQYLRSYLQHHQLWVRTATENHSVVSDFIITNNIQVVFFAFAGGILAGLGTVYVMIANGIGLGVVAAMVWQYKLSAAFWAFVLPHGVIELSVIFMAGGAGLFLGDTLLRPGLRRRRDVIPEVARTTVQVVMGGSMLLVLCGIIEGNFSPSDVPDAFKYAVGVVNLIWLYGYLIASRPPTVTETYTFADVADQTATASISP